MNHESSLGAFLLTALYFIYLVITLAYHIIPALVEYQPLVYITLLFFSYYSNPLLRRRR
jgi:hypothetical protein